MGSVALRLIKTFQSLEILQYYSVVLLRDASLSARCIIPGLIINQLHSPYPLINRSYIKTPAKIGYSESDLTRSI